MAHLRRSVIDRRFYPALTDGATDYRSFGPKEFKEKLVPQIESVVTTYGVQIEYGLSTI
jgi:hypothetical protein